MKLKFIEVDHPPCDPASDRREDERAIARDFPVFDANLFLGPCPFRALQEERESRVILQRAEAQFGLFSSWSALFHKDWKSGFLRDANQTDQGGENLRWNGVVNPTFPKWREDFVSLRSRHRFCSIKICPGLFKDGWNEDMLLASAAFARSENLPLIVVRRLVDDRLVPDWLKFQPVERDSVLAFLEKAKDTRIILSNFSAPEISDLIGDDAQAMDDVFFEVGSQTPLIGWYEQLVSRNLSARLVYASGYPLYYAAGIAGILHACIPPGEMRRILYDNAIELFGL